MSHSTQFNVSSLFYWLEIGNLSTETKYFNESQIRIRIILLPSSEQSVRKLSQNDLTKFHIRTHFVFQNIKNLAITNTKLEPPKLC